MIDRVEVAGGPGTVIRFGAIAAWVGPEASADLVNFLAQSARNVGPSPEGGRVLSDHLAGILAQRDPEPAAPFAVVGPADDSWSLLLHGQVQAWDGSRWLYPSPDAHWTRCEIPAWSTLSVGGASVALPRTALGTQMNLEAGVVPGGGMVIVGLVADEPRPGPGVGAARFPITQVGADSQPGLADPDVPDVPPATVLAGAEGTGADNADTGAAPTAAVLTTAGGLPEPGLPEPDLLEPDLPETGLATATATAMAAAAAVAMGTRPDQEVTSDADSETDAERLPADDLPESPPPTALGAAALAEAGIAAETDPQSESVAVPTSEPADTAGRHEESDHTDAAPPRETSETAVADEATEALVAASTFGAADHPAETDSTVEVGDDTVETNDPVETNSKVETDDLAETERAVEPTATHPAASTVPEPAPRAPGPQGSLYVEALVAKAAAVTRRQPLGRAGAPDASVAGTPVVAGDLCPKGHLNRTGTSRCIRCGSDLTTASSRTTIGPRPPLGCLVTDDARIFRLDRSYMVGSDPGRDPTVRGGTAVPLRLEGPEVAGAHAEIRLHDWDVAVTDRSSAAGTSVLEPGATEWQRLRPFDPRILRAGSQIAFGTRVVTFVSAWEPAGAPAASKAPPSPI